MLISAFNRSRREHTARASSSRAEHAGSTGSFLGTRLIRSGGHCGVALAMPTDHLRGDIRRKAKRLIASAARIRTAFAASAREVDVIGAWAGGPVSKARRCNESSGDGLVV